MESRSDEVLDEIKLEYEAKSETGNKRLDVFLTALHRERSRSFFEKLIKSGLVLVNNKRVKPSYKVKAGDRIKVVIPPPEPSEVKPEPIPLDIVYEDDHIIIINKPAGMVVHPGAGHRQGTLVNALLEHCPEIGQVSGSTRPGIVHRLDKDTSGLIVVAKTQQAYDALVNQIKAREILKVYLGVVHGVPNPSEGIIDKPIGRHPFRRKQMAVVANGRPAVTRYVLLEDLGQAAVLEVKLETGRTHQIRVHMASIGHPVIGDKVYAPRREDYGIKRQALHARLLELRHPVTGRRLRFESPVPTDIEELIQRFRERPGQGRAAMV